MQNPVTLRVVRVQSRPVYMTVCTLSLPRLAKQTAGRAALQVHLSLPFCILCMQHHKHCSVCTHTYLNKHCQGAAPHMFRFQLTCVCSVSAAMSAHVSAVSASFVSCLTVVIFFYAKRTFSWLVLMQRLDALVTCNSRSA